MASSIVACTHQRSGTVRRSRSSASARGRRWHGHQPVTRRRPSVAAGRVAGHGADLDQAARSGAAAPVVRPPRRRRRRPALGRRTSPSSPASAPWCRPGIAMALPEGYVGLVHPRSGLAARHGISIVNAPGTIDAGYRGEVKVLPGQHRPRASRSRCAAATGSPSWWCSGSRAPRSWRARSSRLGARRRAATARPGGFPARRAPASEAHAS